MRRSETRDKVPFWGSICTAMIVQHLARSKLVQSGLLQLPKNFTTIF